MPILYRGNLGRMDHGLNESGAITLLEQDNSAVSNEHCAYLFFVRFWKLTSKVVYLYIMVY